MVVKVTNFVQQYPQCQRLSPYKPAPASLIPMPIINVPFEQVGMDLVQFVPLGTTQRHKYMLVLVNYATRYPEAIPLHKATLKNTA